MFDGTVGIINSQSHVQKVKTNVKRDSINRAIYVARTQGFTYNNSASSK